MHFGEALLHALTMILVMTREIFRALVLSFALSEATATPVAPRACTPSSSRMRT